MMNDLKRILLKLSGEALAGDKDFGFDEATCLKVAEQVKQITDKGTQVAIVIGGGNFWRGRNSSKIIERTKSDQIGMLGTVMNCIYVSEIFRNAGRKAGEYFAKKMLNLNQPLDQFVSELQSKMQELKIGVLRIEKVDEESGKIILNVSEDADCSGLPILGETVCNYDEGFIGGILSMYSGKFYTAVEVDCWATGDRVCRFHANIEDEK